jgi:hypothetical protein
VLTQDSVPYWLHTWSCYWAITLGPLFIYSSEKWADDPKLHEQSCSLGPHNQESAGSSLHLRRWLAKLSLSSPAPGSSYPSLLLQLPAVSLRSRQKVSSPCTLEGEVLLAGDLGPKPPTCGRCLG